MAEPGNVENKDKKPKPSQEEGAGDSTEEKVNTDEVDKKKESGEDKTVANGAADGERPVDTSQTADKSNLKDTASPSLKRIDENSEMESGDNEEREPFVPRIRRLNSKKARYSIRSNQSIRNRFRKSRSISQGTRSGGESDRDDDDDDDDAMIGGGGGDADGWDDNVSRTSYITLQTTEEQSDSNALSFLTDPGSHFGSTLLLASPSYLEIYADTIAETIGKDLETIAEEPEELISPIGSEDIFENPEYIDTCEGNLQLAEVARMIAKDRKRYEQLFDKPHIEKNLHDYYHRVAIIAIAFLLLYTSFYGIRNAQSSLGNDKQLSIMAYGMLYSLMWLGGLLAQPYVWRVKPKYGMAIASIAFVCYPLSNFYARYWTLLPISVITGISAGLLWSTEGVYMMNIASAYALVSEGELVKVIGKFNSIVFSLFLFSNVTGNLLSSVLLGNFFTLPGEEAFLEELAMQRAVMENSTSTTPATAALRPEQLHCGLFFKPSQSGVTVYRYKKYLFFGVNVSLALTGCLLLWFALKPLKVHKVTGNQSVKNAFIRLFKMFKRRRIFFLMPLMVYFGFISTLILSDYNTAFITCQYGAGYVGFVVMTAYVFSVTGAFFGGKIVAKTGRIPVFLTCGFISLAAVICMLAWKPEPGDHSIGVMVFVPLWLWGLSDGVLYTQNSGFLGVLFKKKCAEAFVIQSMFLGMGAVGSTLLMAYGYMTLQFKTWMCFAVNIIAMGSYLTLEILLKKEMI